MDPLKAWSSGVLTPLKNCFNAVKLCIKAWSDIFVGWFFLGFIPGLLVVFKYIKLVGIKGLVLDVALPFVDVVTDSKFVYETYQENTLVRLSAQNHKIRYIREDESYNVTSWNDNWSCFDHIANNTFTPPIVRGKLFFTLSMNVTGLEYKPVTQGYVKNTMLH